MTLLIQSGHVLCFNTGSTPSDPRISFRVQDVLIKDTKIVQISDSIPVPPDGIVLDARDHIVSPGFIDTHRHMWQTAGRGIIWPAALGDQTLSEYMGSMRAVHQPLWSAEDMYWSQLVGSCEAVGSGITTILDHSHAPQTEEHVHRTLDATRESGIRSIYAYSKLNPQAWTAWQSTQIHEIGRSLRESKDQRITLGFGYDSMLWESPEDVKSTMAVSKQAGASLTTVHIVPTHYPPSLSNIHAATQAFSSDFVFSHFNHAQPAEIALVKDLGIGISCTPETELAMSHGFCALFDCVARGIKAGLGVDTHAVCSGDMFGQMRLALQSARSIRSGELYLGSSTRPGDQIPRTLIHKTAHVIRAATLGGAETLNMAEKIGSLEVGKLADIALISLSSPNMLGVTPDDASLTAAMVVFANPSDVRTVVVNGEIVKQNGELKRVRWDETVSRFNKQQEGLSAKFKQATEAANWEKEFSDILKSIGADSKRAV